MTEKNCPEEQRMITERDETIAELQEYIRQLARRTDKTMLDRLAGLAMQAMLSGHFAHYGHENYWNRSGVAEEAYEMAEAMMAERERRLANFEPTHWMPLPEQPK